MARNPNPNRVNKALIRRALDYADGHPDEIDPTACRWDGAMCFPALAADLSRGVWADDALGTEDSPWLIADRRDHPGDVITLVHCHDRARTVLGVDMDFNDETRVEDFRALLATGRAL